MQKHLWGRPSWAAALLALILTSTWATASTDPDRARFCAQTPDELRLDFLVNPASRLAISNQPGPFGFGVCWWHSRFQRNALHLIAFRPSQPRPRLDWLKDAHERKERGGVISTRERQALRYWGNLLDDVFFMRRVVQIPGYSNLYDFSRDIDFLLRTRLSAWQIRDGIGRFGWIRGITGYLELTPAEMRFGLDQVHRLVAQQRRIAYVKLRVPETYPFGGHAWLVAASVKTQEGYDLAVVDSNAPTGTALIRYRFGDSSLEFIRSNENPTQGFIPGITGAKVTLGTPYLERSADLKRMDRARRTYCSSPR